MLSWLLWPLDSTNGVRERARTVGHTATATYHQNMLIFSLLLFCFRQTTWLECNNSIQFWASICLTVISAVVVVSERRLTDIWVKQKHRAGLSYFKCQVSRSIFKKSLYFSLLSLAVSQRPCCPNAITEFFNLLSVVSLTRLQRDLRIYSSC